MWKVLRRTWGSRGWQRCLELLGQNRGVLGMPARVPGRAGGLPSTGYHVALCLRTSPACSQRTTCWVSTKQEAQRGEKAALALRGFEDSVAVAWRGLGLGEEDGGPRLCGHRLTSAEQRPPGHSLHQEESRSGPGSRGGGSPAQTRLVLSHAHFGQPRGLETAQTSPVG